jgi:hypothetical protein
LDINNIGNICFSSITNISNLTTLNAFQPNIGGGMDYYLAKLDNEGYPIWSTYVGGTGEEYSLSISSLFDPNGNIILIGATSSDSNIVSKNAYQSELRGMNDGFIAKFDPTGNRLWASYFGGNLFEFIYNGHVDGAGNSYIVGESYSDSLLTTNGAFQMEYKGKFDGILGKFDPNGNLLWATYYGDSLHEEIHDVDVDSRGNVWISGYTNSPNMATMDGFMTQLYDVNPVDLFLVKFDSLGNRLWASYYGGASTEYTGKLELGQSGDVFLAGTTRSLENINTINSHQENLNGESDYFIVKFKDSDWNLSTNTLALNKDILLYPNPTNTFFQVNEQSNEKLIYLKIIDYQGKEVFQSKKVGASVKYNIENLTTGIYIVQLTFQDSVLFQKIIKN